MHGGTIEARSEGLGRGSEFVVRLPICRRAAAVTAANRASGASAPCRRILVVEDNLDAAETLRLMLKLDGHDVQAVHDGETALERVARWKPEIVLLDLELPKMGGIEVAQRIRAMDGGAELRLIAVTGWVQAETRRHAKQAGFDDHLAKPVDSTQLSTLIGGPLG